MYELKESFGHEDASERYSVGWLEWCVGSVMVSSLAGVLLRLLHGSDAADDVSRGSSTAEVAWSLMYGFAFIQLVSRPRQFARLLVSVPLLLLLTALAVSSIAWSVDPGLTARRAYGLLGSTAIAYYLVSRFSLVDLLRLIVYVGVFEAIASALLVIASPSRGTMSGVYIGAWRGVFGDKNLLGGVMGVTLLSSIPLIKEGRKITKVVCCIGWCICLVDLYKAQAVSSTLVLLMGVIIFFLVSLLKRGIVGWFIVSSLLFGCILAICGLVASGLDVDSVFGALGRDRGFTGRSELWDSVKVAIADRPILGYGYSAFWRPDGDWMRYVALDWRAFHAHNGFLELCLDCGYAGCILFGCLYTRVIWCSARLAFQMRGTTSAWPLIIAIWFLLQNLAESSILKYNELYWTLFVAAAVFSARTGFVGERVEANASDKLLALSGV